METAMTSSEHDLRKGALSGFDSLVMALAGSAPAYSIAASTAVLIAAVGLASPAALLYCAIPMLGIAWAFNYLGRADVNAGASYAWVGRALHPSLGFISGWALIVSATIFMVAGSLPAGSMTLSLFSESLADDTVLVTVVGAAWFLVMVGLVIAGVPSPPGAVVMTGLEVGLLVVFAVLGLLRAGDGAGADFYWSWFGLGGFGGMAGFAVSGTDRRLLLLGLGRDREPQRGDRGSGRKAGVGGLIGVVFVFLLFEAFTVLTNMLLDARRDRGQRGQRAGPARRRHPAGLGGKLLIIAVMLSTIATLETTLIQVSRSLFAMGRDRTLPARFGRTHDVRKTPVFATVVVALVALGLFVASTFLGSVERHPRVGDQRHRPADRGVLRPRRPGRRGRLPQGAVPLGGQLRLHRGLAAARRGVHAVDLRRGDPDPRRHGADRRPRRPRARRRPHGVVLAEEGGLLPHPGLQTFPDPSGEPAVAEPTTPASEADLVGAGEGH